MSRTSLEAARWPCGYCFQRWATGHDHLVPRAAGGLNTPDNLYPACKRCNSLLGDQIFGSIEAKRAYIQEQLEKRGEWNPGLPLEEVNDSTRSTYIPFATDSRPPVGPDDTTYCSEPDCQKPIPKNRKGQLYCSPICRWKAWDKRHPRNAVFIRVELPPKKRRQGPPTGVCACGCGALLTGTVGKPQKWASDACRKRAEQQAASNWRTGRVRLPRPNPDAGLLPGTHLARSVK